MRLERLRKTYCKVRGRLLRLRVGVLVGLVFLAMFLDSFTAFLWSRSKPAEFEALESNRFAVSAYIFGDWVGYGVQKVAFVLSVAFLYLYCFKYMPALSILLLIYGSALFTAASMSNIVCIAGIFAPALRAVFWGGYALVVLFAVEVARR